MKFRAHPQTSHEMIEKRAITERTITGKPLSWLAKGILTYCLCMPEPWELTPKALYEHAAGAGRDKIYQAIDELMESGFLVRIWYTHSNIRVGCEYVIFTDSHEAKAYVEEIRQKKKISGSGIRSYECSTLFGGDNG